jgi:transcriptional regulator with PAS, ATPase and Fis domain
MAPVRKERQIPQFSDRTHMRPDSCGQLTGTSRQIVELKQEIERIACSDAKVLITGESGVGKELVARSIHGLSARSQKPFVAINCAGIPETLLESEMFGHVKGSFTGAYRDKPGKLEMAADGTVMLDEIGEMTVRMQGLLLRFLETGELQKVGADRAAGRVDVRVMAATHRNLREMVRQGQFREDLFYRINVIHLVVPPLRERRADIAPMVTDFLTRFTRGNGEPPRTISPEALAVLTEYRWPGNVRQLENVIERLLVVSRNPIVRVEDLPVEIRAPHVAASAEPNDKVADHLYQRLTTSDQSFWTTVYPLFMQREITRSNMRGIVQRGLEEARGNYRIVLRLFNMEPTEYKKFLNFLRKHDCQLPFQDFRSDWDRSGSGSRVPVGAGEES